MAVSKRIEPGDFSQLATHYAKYRPHYAQTVLHAIRGIFEKATHAMDFVDVGAGTGIFTRQFASLGFHSVTAIEPNDAMRQEGINDTTNITIRWAKGSAENTGLSPQCADIVTMASSFHWADFDLATQEFHRILRPGGYLCIIWNPRYLEEGSLLKQIENKIHELEPTIQRVSSGKSKHVDQLAAKLEKCALFNDMIHIEGKHTASLSKEAYLGVWKSVNDIRAQLGEAKFQQFLDYTSDAIKNLHAVDCIYQTRAWIVRKAD